MQKFSKKSIWKVVNWHLYFWPFWVAFKTFLLKLIQPWLVGHFEGLTNGYQPAWNEFAIANGYWAISINSHLYPQLDFGLYWGCLEAEITKRHLGKFSRPKWIRSSPRILTQPQGSLSSKILLGTTLLDPHPVQQTRVLPSGRNLQRRV